MTGPTLALFLLILASTGILTVLGVGLFRNAGRLVRAVKAFSSEAMPIVDEISGGLDAASRHMEDLAAAASSIRSRN